MATPVHDEFVRLVGDVSTLHLGTPLIMCRKFEDLRSVGRSFGTDREADSVDGREARWRGRDWLPVTLEDIQINGRYDDDGDLHPNPIENAVATLRTLIAWPDLQASNRLVAVELTEFGTVFEAECGFEEWGPITRPSPWIYELSGLITVHDGVLVEAAP